MSLKFGLLGLLGYSDMTGYDLTKVFNDSLRFFWKAQPSQIYRDLTALEKEDCLTFEIEEQKGKPSKKIYSITEKGKNKFYQWVNDYDFTKEVSYRESMLMKIFFGASGDDTKLEESLMAFMDKNRRYKEEHLKVIEVMKSYASKNENLKRNHTYWRMVHARGLVQADANVEWAKRAIGILKEAENGSNES